MKLKVFLVILTLFLSTVIVGDAAESSNDVGAGDVGDAAESSNDSGWKFIRTTSYHSRGVDPVLPHDFFKDTVLSQMVALGYTGFYPSGIYIGGDHKISPSGGSLSDFGDRTTLFVGAYQNIGPTCLRLHHSYVHVNYMLEDWWYHGDRQITTFQADAEIGMLKPYARLAFDIPSHFPVNKFFFWGAVGVVLNVPLEELGSEIGFDFSITDSLINYRYDAITLVRGRIFMTKDLGFIPVSVSPEVNIMKNIENSNGEYVTWWGVGVSF